MQNFWLTLVKWQNYLKMFNQSNNCKIAGDPHCVGGLEGESVEILINSVVLKWGQPSLYNKPGTRLERRCVMNWTCYSQSSKMDHLSSKLDWANHLTKDFVWYGCSCFEAPATVLLIQIVVCQAMSCSGKPTFYQWHFELYGRKKHQLLL